MPNTLIKLLIELIFHFIDLIIFYIFKHHKLRDKEKHLMLIVVG